MTFWLRSTVVFSLLFAVQASATGGLRLHCVNTAHSPLTFDTVIDSRAARMQFGVSSSGTPLENDLVQKLVTLQLNLSRTGGGWLSYEGVIVIDPRFDENRTVELRLRASDINSGGTIRAVLMPSDTHAANEAPAASTSYSTLCTRL